jgi:hypothetical protein
MSERPPTRDYLAAWLHDRLAEDGRINELGISVRLAGDSVVLTGVVTTPERRAMVASVAAELCPELAVRNEVVVGSYAEPSEAETEAFA